MPSVKDLTLEVSQSIEIEAAVGDVYNGLIRRLTTDNSTPDNKPLPMVLEEWPGGRWFRDLGNGMGHLWGAVQVIKPPTLLEIHGPMFMSYAAAGHIQYRLTQIAGGTELSLRHQVIGLISEEHRLRVGDGWNFTLQQIKAAVTQQQ